MKNSIIGLLVFSLLLTVWVLLPYSINIVHGLPNVIDPLFYAWNLSYNADNWFKGINHLLNTNIFYPLTNTIAYSDTLWGQSFFVNPIIWITHNPILAQNLAIIITFPLSALSMFLLSMYFTNNKLASFVAGIFYAFSYPRLSQIGHLPTVSSQWLPLYILYLFKFLKSGNLKNIILLCFWYILSITSSIYFGVFLLPITVVIVVGDFLKRLHSHTLYEYKKRIVTLLLVLIPFIVFVGIVLFPYIRLKVENPEIKRSIDDVTHLRANLIDYISVLPTSLNTYKLPRNTNEHVLFPTFTLLLLSLVGLVTSRRQNKYMMIIFVCLALTSFILSLGNEQSLNIGSFSTGTLKMPYYYLYKFFPIFQIVRVPARFGIFVILSLCVLATWGIESLLKFSKSRWVIVIFLCTFLIEIWQTNTLYVSIPSETAIPQVYQWIIKQPEPIILAEVPISLFYHGNVMENQLYLLYPNLERSDTYALETYREYFSIYHKKRMINGYSGFLPESYNRIAEILENFPSEYTIKTLQDIGVTHVIVHIWQYNNNNEIQKALTNSSMLILTYSDNNDLVYMIHKKN